MNNTFCLGIFLILVYARTLPWTFSAETIAIFLIQACKMCCSHPYAHAGAGAGGHLRSEEDAPLH